MNVNLLNMQFDEIKSIVVERSESEEISQIQNFLRQLKIINYDAVNALSISLNASDFAKAIIACCDICRKGNYLYIYDSSSKLMTDLHTHISKLVSLITTKYDKLSMFKVHSVYALVNDTFRLIQSRFDEFRHAKNSPDYYVLTSDGKCLNFKNKSISDESEILKQYDMFYRSPCKLIRFESLTNDIDKTKFMFLSKILSQVLDDWSNSDSEQLKFIQQMSFASICGFNREKMIFLMGDGGNGKSTFLEMNSSLVGMQSVVNINLHQFNDPNAINKINESTRFLNGDDFSKKGLSGDSLISNFKTLVAGNKLSVNKKYQDNVDIQTNALFIQATNHEPEFFEITEAIKSRAIFHKWGAASFRGKETKLKDSSETFNLKDLIKDQFFIDIYFTSIFDDVDYFLTFDIPEKSKHLIDEVLKDSDLFSLFIEDLLESSAGWDIIPLKIALAYMKNWSKLNAPHLSNMKINTFTKELKIRSNLFDYKVVESRINFNSPKYKMTKSLCDLLQLDISLLSDRQFYIEVKNTIDKQKVDSFDESLTKDLTNEDVQVLKIKAYQEENTELMSKFSDYL